MWLNNETTDLEMLIDRHGLAEVLDAIAGICSEKADHVRASYSDETLAAQWDAAAKRVAGNSANSAVAAVSKR